MFVVGGFGFWVLMAGLVLWLFACVDRDWGLGATGALVATALLLWLFGNFNAFHWVAHHKVAATAYALSYVGCGVVWSFVKWIIWGKKRAETVTEFRAGWMKSHHKPTFDDMGVPEFDLYQRDRRGEFSLDESGKRVRKMTAEEEESKRYDMLAEALERYQRDYLTAAQTNGYAERTKDGALTTKPQFKQNHKRQVTLWATYWPISLIWTFADDVVTECIRATVNVLSGQYQAVMDRIFRETDKVV